MSEIDYKQICEDLHAYLHTMYKPVGMKWLKTEEELMAIPKVRIHKNHYPPCVVVSHALQYGWTSACKADNIHNNYCRGVHGLVDRPKEWYSGEVFLGVWYDDPGCAAGHHAALECVNPDYYALVASPLDSGRIEPDVAVLYLSTSQAFLLYAAYQFDDYEKLQFSFVGESTCSDSWIHTLITGKPGMGLPCFADRKFAGIGEWELRVTFSPADLDRSIKNLKKMFKNGLRHPIAPSSLQTDILSGLPPSYLNY